MQLSSGYLLLFLQNSCFGSDHISMEAVTTNRGYSSAEADNQQTIIGLYGSMSYNTQESKIKETSSVNGVVKGMLFIRTGINSFTHLYSHARKHTHTRTRTHTVRPQRINRQMQDRGEDAVAVTWLFSQSSISLRREGTCLTCAGLTNYDRWIQRTLLNLYAREKKTHYYANTHARVFCRGKIP